MNVTELVDQFGTMTLDELRVFVRQFEKTYGVEVAQPQLIIAPVVPEIPEEVPLQTEFSIQLLNPGPAKIKIIQAVRRITNLTMVESKQLVDQTPSVIVADVDEEKANQVLEELKGLGAEVAIS
jgi:large subunit ribosomal protein L7/L12